MGNVITSDNGKGWLSTDESPRLSTPADQAGVSLKVNGPGFHLIPCAALLRDLLSYWENQRTDRLMPARRNVDAADIPTLLPFVYMVDVDMDPIDFTYRLMGSGIVARSKGDYTGLRLRDLPSQAPPSQIWSLFEAAVIHQSPQALFVPLIAHPNLHVEMLAMPLSCDDHRVDILLGGISFDLIYQPYDDSRSVAAN